MQHPTRTKTAKDSNGQFRTIDQMLRSTMKLADYGKWLASQQKAGN